MLFRSCLPSLSERSRKIKEINEYAQAELKKIDGIKFNSANDASPYIINICVPTFMRSQTIIQELSANYGIFVSSGSACAKGKRSHVLSAMGLADDVIDKSIRISLSKFNTKEDIDALISALTELIEKHPKE